MMKWALTVSNDGAPYIWNWHGQNQPFFFMDRGSGGLMSNDELGPVCRIESQAATSCTDCLSNIQQQLVTGWAVPNQIILDSPSLDSTENFIIQENFDRKF